MWRYRQPGPLSNPLYRAVVAALCLLPLWAGAQEEGGKEDSLLGLVITPGIGARVLDLHVTRKSDGASGTVTSDGSFTGPLYVALNIESPTYLFNEKLGMTFRGHAASFSLDNQRVQSDTTESGEDIKDLGTRVDGHYSYFMPTLFYRSVDPAGDSRIGIGYGYWKAWFSGEVILAQNNNPTATMPRTSVSGATDGKTGLLVFWQGRWPKGLFEISISKVKLGNADFKYELNELNMMIGYHFEF